MDKKTVEKFKSILLEKKRNLLSQLMNASDEYKKFMENKGGDIADEATDTYEKYLLYDLCINERQELDDINDVLQNIEDKTFGICEDCGVEIEKKRLEAKPYAKYCIRCREKKESTEKI